MTAPPNTEFRQFLEARRAKAGHRPVNAPVVKLVKPTVERLEKADHPLRTEGGFYRTPSPVERLRNRGALDPLPRVNEGMFTAANDLYRCFYLSGLVEHIRSMDLTGVGGGSTTASSYMPVSELAAHNRERFQTGCKRMGWYEAYPYRGAGRLTVDIICRERSLRDTARSHFPGTRMESAQSAALDRLREGLFTLAIHWKHI